MEDNDCEGDADRQFDCDAVGGGEQGITQGCADTYLYTLGTQHANIIISFRKYFLFRRKLPIGILIIAYLDCQWIDITDVPVGNYLLRLHANPGHNVAETDYYNNIAVCNLIYEPGRLYAFNCHIPDDYENSFIRQFYSERAYTGM